MPATLTASSSYAREIPQAVRNNTLFIHSFALQFAEIQFTGVGPIRASIGVSLISPAGYVIAWMAADYTK